MGSGGALEASAEGAKRSGSEDSERSSRRNKGYVPERIKRFWIESLTGRLWPRLFFR